mgnify:CR=1 FL=1
MNEEVFYFGFTLGLFLGIYLMSVIWYLAVVYNKKKQFLKTLDDKTYRRYKEMVM